MSEEKKKKATFRKIEDGMILESEDGRALAFGFPNEVEKRIEGEGKAGISLKGIGGEGKGEKYSRIKYNWHILPTEEKEFTEKEVNAFSESIPSASGTFPVTYSTYVHSKAYKACEKCGASNPIEAKYCLNCGYKFESKPTGFFYYR